MVQKRYTVMVSNVGIVYSSQNKDDALARFHEYVERSKSGRVRGAGESVTLFDRKAIVKKFVGQHDRAEQGSRGLAGGSGFVEFVRKHERAEQGRRGLADGDGSMSFGGGFVGENEE